MDPQSDPHHQEQQELIHHHYYHPSEAVKEPGLGLIHQDHQQEQEHHHHQHLQHHLPLTAAGLMQAVAAEIQLGEQQEQLPPNPSENSAYPIYSYYRSEGDKESHESSAGDIAWR